MNSSQPGKKNTCGARLKQWRQSGKAFRRAVPAHSRLRAEFDSLLRLHEFGLREWRFAGFREFDHPRGEATSDGSFVGRAAVYQRSAGDRTRSVSRRHPSRQSGGSCWKIVELAVQTSGKSFPMPCHVGDRWQDALEPTPVPELFSSQTRASTDARISAGPRP